MKTLTKKEKEILLEYADWYDSMQGDSEKLIQEFEEQRGSTKKEIKERATHESFAMEH